MLVIKDKELQGVRKTVKLPFREARQGKAAGCVTRKPGPASHFSGDTNKCSLQSENASEKIKIYLKRPLDLVVRLSVCHKQLLNTGSTTGSAPAPTASHHTLSAYFLMFSTEYWPLPLTLPLEVNDSCCSDPLASHSVGFVWFMLPVTGSCYAFLETLRKMP